MNSVHIAAKRARLAALEAALARLQAEYDALISAFKFDEARDLAASIATHEAERRSLMDTLPPAPEATPQPYSMASRRRRVR